MQWVTGKIPNDDRRVLVTYKPRRISPPHVVTARYSGGAWRFMEGKFKSAMDHRVTAWAEWPEPYIKQEI